MIRLVSIILAATIVLGGLCMAMKAGAADSQAGRALIETAISDSASAARKGELEKAWNCLGSIDPNSSASSHVSQSFGGLSAVSQMWESEQWHRRFRNQGMALCKQDFEHPQCIAFVKSAVWSARVGYWLNEEQAAAQLAVYNDHNNPPVLLDAKAKEEWDSFYLQARTILLASDRVGAYDKTLLRRQELANELFAMEDLKRRGQERDTSVMVARVLDMFSASSRAPLSSGDEQRQMEWFDIHYIMSSLLRLLDGTPDVKMAMLQELMKIQTPGLKAFAAGQIQQVLLTEKPLELKAQGLNGAGIDVAKLRGKVVLVDIWSNGCATCVEMMPKLQKIYEKYRERGFEILGVWNWSESMTRPPHSQTVERQKKTALGFLEQKGATWPNGAVKYEEFGPKYGIEAFPITWLLDQNGKLVTSDITGPRLESEVRRLLGQQ